MRPPRTQRKCQHCQTFFAPDPRSARRQRYCAKPACRQASKAASQHRWLQQPGNRDYFTGPTHVERVRQWRRAHPGYWRRQGARTPHALQEDLTPQAPQKQPLEGELTPYALQDDFLTQPAGVVGLIAHLTGLTLQEDIATTARRLQQLGRDILCAPPHHQGGIQDAQTPHCASQTPTRPPAVQLGGSNPDQVTTPVSHRLSSEPTITVIDPRHPLCGRTLTLVAMTHHSELGRCCVVWLRPQVERLVPVRATNLEFDPNDLSPAPLSLTAVEQLLRVFHDIEHASKGVHRDASPPLPSRATTRVRPPAGPPPALGVPVSEPATARAHGADPRRATVARSSATPSTT